MSFSAITRRHYEGAIGHAGILLLCFGLHRQLGYVSIGTLADCPEALPGYLMLRLGVLSWLLLLLADFVRPLTVLQRVSLLVLI